MAFGVQVVVGQIEPLMLRYEELKSRTKYDDFSDLPEDEVTELVTLMFAAIERLSPPNSRYVENARAYSRAMSGNIGVALTPFLGILRALRSDYTAGNLRSIAELIRADVFSDFLEMAEYLVQQGYKDPAAVIVGAVLEEHLRKLCDKSGLATHANGAPKKADMLNAELAAQGVYGKLDQKSVTAWLDLRNKAAHGRYAEYTKEQVALTLQGVRDFILRYPA